MYDGIKRRNSKNIGVDLPNSVSNIQYVVLESIKEEGYIRQLIEYDSYGDKVRAMDWMEEFFDINKSWFIAFWYEELFK